MPLLLNIAYASLFLFVLGTAGSGVARLFRDSFDFSFNITISLSLVILAIWFLPRSMDSQVVITGAVITIVLLALGPGLTVRSWGENGRDVMSVVFTVTVVAVVYRYLSHGQAIATLGNNDIFNWYAVADHFSGRIDYYNMAPDARATYNWLRLAVDGFGTDWFLVFSSLGTKESIMSAPVTLVILTSWIVLSLRDQLSKVADVSRYYAVATSLYFVFTPLIVYVAFNGFFAQLLGTASGIQLASAVLESSQPRLQSVVRKTILFFIPSIFLILVYQSGYALFQLVAFGLGAVIYAPSCFMESEPNWLRNHFRQIALPHILAVLLTFAIVPSIAWYMISRTVQVSGITAGWGLVPFVPEIISKYSTAFGPLAPVLVLYGAFASLILWAFFEILASCESVWRRRILRRSIVWFGALVLIYFGWYLTGRSPYQNWKYASFFIYSLGFVCLAPVVLCFSSGILQPARGINAWVARIVTCLLVPLVGVWSVAYLAKYHDEIFVYDDGFVKELVGMRDHIPAGVPVILDTPQYGMSMLPMLLLSARNPLFPLRRTYSEPAGLDAVYSLHDPLVLQERTTCRTVPIQKVLFESGHYILGRTTLSHHSFTQPLRYSFSEGCVAAWLNLERGVSDSEKWGRWSDGSSAAIRVMFPARQVVTYPLFVDLDVSPYLPPSLGAQRVRVAVDGREIADYAISTRQIITLKIPETFCNAHSFELTFEFPDARSPASYGSLDRRLLALAFYSITVYPVANSKTEH